MSCRSSSLRISRSSRVLDKTHQSHYPWSEYPYEEHQVPHPRNKTEFMKTVTSRDVTQRNNTEEYSSHLLRDGSLKSHNRIHDSILYFKIANWEPIVDPKMASTP
jgi:hypothetical protein